MSCSLAATIERILTAGLTSAIAATGMPPVVANSSATSAPADPPSTASGPAPMPSSARRASIARGASAAAWSITGAVTLSTASAIASSKNSASPPGSERLPNIGNPRYTRHAGNPAIGSAAAIAASVRGGSIRCQLTTNGASAEPSAGASAVYGTPAATPVIGVDGVCCVPAMHPANHAAPTSPAGARLESWRVRHPLRPPRRGAA